MSDIRGILSGLIQDDPLSEPKSMKQILFYLDNMFNQQALEINLLRQEAQLSESKNIVTIQQMQKEFQDLKESLNKKVDEILSEDTKDSLSNSSRLKVPQNSQMIGSPRDLSVSTNTSVSRSSIYETDYGAKMAGIEKKLKQLSWKVSKKSLHDRSIVKLINKLFNQDFKEKLAQTEQSFFSELVDNKLSQFRMIFDQKFSGQASFLHNVAQAMRRLDGIMNENKETFCILKEEVIVSQKVTTSKTEKMLEQVEELQTNITMKIDTFQQQLGELVQQFQLIKNVQIETTLARLRNDIDNLKRQGQVRWEENKQQILQLDNRCTNQLSVIEALKSEQTEIEGRIQRHIQDNYKNLTDLIKQQVYTNPNISSQGSGYNETMIRQIKDSMKDSLSLQGSRHQVRERERTAPKEDTEVNQKLQTLMDSLAKLLSDFRKSMEERAQSSESRNLSRRSVKRPPEKEKEKNTEENEFDDQKIFSPNRSLHIVGQIKDIARRRPITIKKSRLESLHYEITNITSMMFNTPKGDGSLGYDSGDVPESCKTTSRMESRSIRRKKPLKAHIFEP